MLNQPVIEQATMQASALPAVSQTSLTAFDGILLLIVVVSTLLAFRRGIIRVLFSLAGFVVGLVLAAWNYADLALWLHQWVISLAAAEITAFLAILFGVMVVASIVASVVRRMAKTVGLGFVDRLLGAAFGVFRGVLLGVAVMLAVAAFVPDSPWLRKSTLAPYFLAGSHAVSFVVPEQLATRIAHGAAELLERTPDPSRPNPVPAHL
jgi:membrane protein required for colicin V production